MKYSIGNYVRKEKFPNDNYVVTHTKDDKNRHERFNDGGDYLIQKEWDFATKSDVKGAPLEIVFEGDIFS